MKVRLNGIRMSHPELFDAKSGTNLGLISLKPASNAEKYILYSGGGGIDINEFRNLGKIRHYGGNYSTGKGRKDL